MANRQTVVVGALGVLMGIAVGASSAQRAETVSFSGNNPNTAAETQDLHAAPGILRQRSTETEARVTPPERSPVESNVAARRQMRLGDIFHLAAPTWSLRGITAPRQALVPECAKYSSTRYTRCLEAFIRGEPYEGNYFPIQYENFQE